MCARGEGVGREWWLTGAQITDGDWAELEELGIRYTGLHVPPTDFFVKTKVKFATPLTILT